MRRVWKDEPLALADEPPRYVVDLVRQTMRQRTRRRRVIRWTSLVLAPACTLMLLWGVRHQAVGPAPGSRESANRGELAPRELFVMSEMAETFGGIAADRRIPIGTEMTAPTARSIRIGTLDGTSVTLEPHATLTAVETGATKRFALKTGAIRAHVKKLGSDERFLVDTADAEVEVHGTQFRVETLAEASPCAIQTKTRVAVSEGVVSVRWSGREVRLFPGDKWPSECVATTVTPPPPPMSPPPMSAPLSNLMVRHEVKSPAKLTAKPAIVTRVPTISRQTRNATKAKTALERSVTSSVAHGEAPVGPTSSLEGQNDLFTSALRAKRSGQDRLAVSLLDQFVQRYPASPLVESALAQRMRLFAKDDVRSSARAAADYLARFPDGFARAEARALVSRAGTPAW